MTVDTTTFLVALYTIVDDLYKAKIAPLRTDRRGRPAEVSDSEILTLMLLAQWLKVGERGLLRYARENWHSYFPRLLSQSAFNRRARRLAGVLMRLIADVAAEMGSQSAVFQVLDTVPVPLMRRCRGEKHRLFAQEADIGRGGSDRQWYYGCQLLVAATDQGVITGFVLGPSATEERWLAESLFCWRIDRDGEIVDPQALPKSHKRGGQHVGPTGPTWPPDAVGLPACVPYIADDGFNGAFWFEHWRRDYGAIVLTPSSYSGDDAKRARREHRGWKQIIESINGQLEDVFALAYPGARTMWGLLTRVAAKLLALNLGIWLNRLFGRDDFALATLFNS